MLNNLKLNDMNFYTDAQSQWNSLEHSLISAADIVAPMSEFKSSTKTGHNELPLDIRKMLQRRKYILRIEKCKKDKS